MRKHFKRLFGEEGLECLVLNHHVSNSSQSLSSFFLLLQQFPAPTDIASMELGQDIFSVGFDCLSGDDLFTNSSLDHNLEQLSIDMLLEFCHPLSSEPFHLT